MSMKVFRKVCLSGIGVGFTEMTGVLMTAVVLSFWDGADVIGWAVPAALGGALLAALCTLSIFLCFVWSDLD